MIKLFKYNMFSFKSYYSELLIMQQLLKRWLNETKKKRVFQLQSCLVRRMWKKQESPDDGPDGGAPSWCKNCKLETYGH